ncbi:GNAT family N-acetyltransferase [Spongiimicrobium sp. 3-5]|uniref:GNAT family N-acetyltransferase n=1 Tax=Spongiimicrobium sp. 3-5 TaxID=3332596 RepID=UPI00397EC426
MSSQDNLLIRKATFNDAGAIALLGRITFTETFGDLFRDKQDLLSYYNRTFSVEKIRNGIQKANNIFWIALKEELPVGYAKLKLNADTPLIKTDLVCQLQKIYVLRDFLGHKIGFKLQEEVLSDATNRGFNEIYLSVLASNDRAINFYNNNDFSKIGEHDFQIGKENFEFIWMSRALNS